MGWVGTQRNKGGIVFVDLRDRSGILQIIFEENDIGAEGFEKGKDRLDPGPPRPAAGEVGKVFAGQPGHGHLVQAAGNRIETINGSEPIPFRYRLA